MCILMGFYNPTGLRFKSRYVLLGEGGIRAENILGVGAGETDLVFLLRSAFRAKETISD